MKNTNDINNEIHHFCRIKGKTMVNNRFIQIYHDGTSFDRYSLEYVFVVDLFIPMYSTCYNKYEFIELKVNQ